jgi:hypothetical protein
LPRNLAPVPSNLAQAEIVSLTLPDRTSSQLSEPYGGIRRGSCARTSASQQAVEAVRTVPTKNIRPGQRPACGQCSLSTDRRVPRPDHQHERM